MKKKRPWQKRIFLKIALVCSSAQSCPTLCNPMDCRPPGSSVHGVLQARILIRLPFPPPGDLPDPWIEPVSPVGPTVAGRFFTTELPGKPKNIVYLLWNSIFFIFVQYLIFDNQILKFSEFSAVKKKCFFQTYSLGTDLRFISFLPPKLQLSRYEDPGGVCIFPFQGLAALFSWLVDNPSTSSVKENCLETSLVVWWLRIHASNAGDAGLIPGQGIKIPYAVHHRKTLCCS